MADGMNGLLIGLSIFWTACLLHYAPPELQSYLTLMLLGLIILLLYNLAGPCFSATPAATRSAAPSAF